jgi:diguanylate cyclase (GGDEF)-like protein
MKLPPFNPEDFLILIVDDISQNIGLLVDILENAQYNTTFAKKGKQAIERVKSSNPDLILLDLMMPEMDGLEVCQILKQNKDFSHIPIIFLTASAEDDYLLKAFDKGAVDYVTKPFKTPELLARVKTHLDLKRTRDELEKAYFKMEKLAKDMNKLATTDDLTQISNRRSILEFAQQQFQRNKRYECECAVIILDIDYFKKINDKYGHDIGDKILIGVTQILKNSIRSVDRVGRFGGEEFLIILPKTLLKDALVVAERLRKSIEDLTFTVEEDRFQVTISLGVDCCQTRDKTLGQVIKRADQALFIAKDNGRNQVYSLEEILQ